MKLRIMDDSGPDGFVSIPNSTVRDRGLSWKARGVLAYLLSHANGFDLNYKAVLNGSDKDGNTSTRSALTELEESGYLRREQGRHMEQGRFGVVVWHIDKRGRMLQAQEELPLQFDPKDLVPENMEFLPGNERQSKPVEPAATAREFAELVMAEWHGMILAARPVDVFGTEFQRPKVTDKRLKHLKARMSESEWMSQWRDAIVRIGKIDGLHGRAASADGRTWQCDVDWFLKPDSVTKVMEGKYDSWQRSTARQPVEAEKTAYSGGV